MRSIPLGPAGFCLLLLLNGCVAPPQKAQIVPPAAASRGTIVAVRPVPVGAPEPARVLLSGLAGAGPSDGDHVYEFIVRTENGAMISVVQPESAVLLPGEHVSILRGAETRIDALPSGQGSR
jgi:outer membrane lipoprotein SlyB